MTQPDADLLIIGGGIMGAGVARAVRDAHPHARITMVDTGPVIGSVAGRHLHDTEDEELWLRYNRRVEAGTQALYVGAQTTPDIGETVVGAPGGMYHLGAFGEDAAELPAAAIGWNSGGMGVHWTAATPLPYGQEVFDFVEPREWDADLARAQELLHVHPCPYGATEAGDLVVSRLREVFDDVSDPGRHVQPMPMAIQPVPAGEDARHGVLRRTGPSVIFPPIGHGTDDRFLLLSDTLCLKVLMNGERATGALVRNLVTGEEHEIRASAVVVCADALRSPQLLWASGVRTAALGRHLNEHVFVSGRVFVDLDRVPVDLSKLRLPLPGEWCVASHWLPHSGSRQPFQGQIMSSLLLESDLRTPYGYSVQLSWYVPTETQAENRVEFSDSLTDAAGLPRMRVRFSYSDKDRETIAAGLKCQQQAGQALGDFDPERDSAVLAPGSSLHYTGTVRMGPHDDGTSVCDPDGRVWGTDNLFVAGNGVIPTPMTANTTLTGMVTAVRAARGLTRGVLTRG
ncbi:GMC oxidoreductase [Streptomyces shenzhenensis]|uniref:Choline dehydrogenase n=1 Tax=Streptomyces shenzhenensis TaxID=943815 RepID=A0A3M0HYX5_9ACTN|nr:GMC oxidoreductase [Streptomyces shenzhenensis]RMB81824.1 choline dehydrogenase [Streptomyces shenzhenensis]